MNVVFISKSDLRGGAAVVTFRLMMALRELGIDAHMLVTEKLSESTFVHLACPTLHYKVPFIAERLQILAAEGCKTKNLFKVDSASFGLPLWHNELVRQADVICLGWVNQGMLSLTGVKKIASMGKPIIWTMHDMWNMTGICHHTNSCEKYMHQCGNCPLLGSNKHFNDLSHKIYLKKQALYHDVPIKFIAVSNWLAEKAYRSSLLSRADIEVIPNPFSFKFTLNKDERTPAIIFGAARLDEEIKDLPTFVRALRILKDRGRGDNIEVITYGAIRDMSALCGMPFNHRHVGIIRGEDEIANLYSKSTIVVSSSKFETLPGTLVEGQAYGCIPVAFNRGGQKDIVVHMETGYLAEWNEDPELRARRLADGLDWALDSWSVETAKKIRISAEKNFSAENIANRYLKLFQTLLNNIVCPTI